MIQTLGMVNQFPLLYARLARRARHALDADLLYNKNTRIEAT